jgi:hypothetical protein
MGNISMENGGALKLWQKGSLHRYPFLQKPSLQPTLPENPKNVTGKWGTF